MIKFKFNADVNPILMHILFFTALNLNESVGWTIVAAGTIMFLSSSSDKGKQEKLSVTQTSSSLVY